MKSKKNEADVKDILKRFESNLEKQTKKEKEKLLNSLNFLYRQLRRKGIVGKRIESILVHLKRRIGGFSCYEELAQTAEKDLIDDLLDVVDSLGGIASMREILIELHKRGWRIQERDLIDVVYSLAKQQGVFSISRGVVFRGNILELQLTRKIIEELHQKSMSIKELAEKLKRDVCVIEIVLESLKNTGVIILGKNKVFLIR